MRWLLASMYLRRHRDIIAAEGVALRYAPDVVDITCPACGVAFVGDLAPDVDPAELEAETWAVEEQLRAWPARVSSTATQRPR
jgi:hypothetical protein